MMTEAVIPLKEKTYQTNRRNLKTVMSALAPHSCKYDKWLQR